MCFVMAKKSRCGEGPIHLDTDSFSENLFSPFSLRCAWIKPFQDYGASIEHVWKIAIDPAYLVSMPDLQVPVPTVVAGDIVVLGTGDVVPADLRLFEAKDFKVSEMALTGEPDDVAKTSKVKESDHSPADSTGVIITS